MAALFLDESLDPARLVPGALVQLGGAEAHHAVAVSRLRPGERVRVGDGSGTIAEGVVESTGRDELSVRVERVRHEPEPSPRIVLVQALAKGDRDELAVQAACEVGVDAVVPWQAERSVSRWSGPKAERGVERWRAIVREASKQSLRSRVPEVRPLEDTAALVWRTAAAQASRTLVLDPDAERPLSRVGATLAAESDAVEEVILVVGPEGGIAPGELERLEQAGAIPVRLGPGVLRTSTAGPVAVGLLHLLLGRW